MRIPPQNIFSFTSPPPALESAQISPNGNIYSAIMITVTSYSAAIVMCFITMLCWGSWANTQKMVKGNWPFPLFYWDYSIGVLAFSLLLALTAGSLGSGGRPFLQDLGQAEWKWLASAFIGGTVFNLANILLVAAIEIAGLAVAFPVGIGLALALGVVTTYLATGEGNVPMLAAGVALICAAIVLDAVAYGRLGGKKSSTAKGVLISVAAGVLMGFFYSFVAKSMAASEPSGALESGKLTPYTAVVLFSAGLILSNFIFNTFMMRKPLSGRPSTFSEYFGGSAKTHAIGILGGVIWSCGMNFNILAAPAADPALAYGLGQGATMVSALWGVFVWKEFAGAPKGTNKLIALMFAFFAAGLGVLVASKL